VLLLLHVSFALEVRNENTTETALRDGVDSLTICTIVQTQWSNGHAAELVQRCLVVHPLRSKDETLPNVDSAANTDHVLL